MELPLSASCVGPSWGEQPHEGPPAESLRSVTWGSSKHKPATCPTGISPGSHVWANNVLPGNKEVITVPYPYHHPNIVWEEERH